MKEARFYTALADEEVQCFLCAHRCRIVPGERGVCGVRENQGGSLYTLVYGRLATRHLEPIEKTGLFHFHPGSKCTSIGTMGCNFSCTCCQNADLALTPREQGIILGEDVPPDQVVAAAKSSRAAAIAYTYVEPTIFLEYVLDVASEARQADIRNVFITNGYLTGEALDELLPVLDAASVSLKSFNEDFYAQHCGAGLEPVLETIARLHRAGVWLEVSTTIIPGLNDNPLELKQLAQFLCDISPIIPWHVTAFTPAHRLLDHPATDITTLRRVRDLGLETGLHHVYTGNVPGDRGENTYCRICKGLLIDRYGFSVEKINLWRECCPICGEPLTGVGIP